MPASVTCSPRIRHQRTLTLDVEVVNVEVVNVEVVNVEVVNVDDLRVRTRAAPRTDANWTAKVIHERRVVWSGALDAGRSTANSRISADLRPSV